MAKKYGMDLGTANTVICHRGQIVLNEPSIVAISDSDGEPIAIGREAKSMLGKTPMGISAFQPLKDGVIADGGATTKMTRGFLEQIQAFSVFSRPIMIVSTPYSATEVEKEALEHAIRYAGARDVALIDEPLAAAIGAGLRVGIAKGSMIVDIGGGSTEAAVISQMGIVRAESIKIAGNAFDLAIAEYIEQTRNVIIGLPTAEKLKMECGSAFPRFDSRTCTVAGMDKLNSHKMGTTLTVSGGEIREALKEPLDMIAEAIEHTLKITPPELSADIYGKGITLTGGGSCILGIPQMLEQRLGIKVVRVKNKRPLLTVCEGIARVMESEELLGTLLQYRR